MVEAMGNRALCLQQDGRQWAEQSAWVSGGKVAYRVQPTAPWLPLCSSGDAGCCCVFFTKAVVGIKQIWGKLWGKRKFLSTWQSSSTTSRWEDPSLEHPLELTFCRSQLCQCWWRSETHYRRVVCSTELAKFTLTPVCSLNWRKVDRGSIGWYRSVDERWWRTRGILSRSSAKIRMISWG